MLTQHAATIANKMLFEDIAHYDHLCVTLITFRSKIPNVIGLKHGSPCLFICASVEKRMNGFLENIIMLQ